MTTHDPLAPSHYVELAPPPELAPLVACLWIGRSGDAPAERSHRVLPDGCADLLLIDDGEPEIVGPSSTWFVAELAPRATILGVRFRPGRMPDALGVPAPDLLDRQVPLDLVWRDGARALHDTLDARDDADRLARVAALLARRWQGRTTRDALAQRAIRWLATHRGAPLGTLARESGLGERQLRRRVEAAAGYGPRTVQRIARFRHLLGLAAARRGAPLSRLALDAGYADQAHMSREVRALSGTTPARLLRREPRGPVSDSFKT